MHGNIEAPILFSSSLANVTQQPAPTKTLTSTTPTPNNYRSRLLQFYQQYNPAKVSSVDETLSNYQGREEELFAKLSAKYETPKTSLLPTGETGPVCYLDVVKYGRIKVQLFADVCPLACENFRALCTGELGVGRAGKPRCYRNSVFHRVVPNFVIQSGDYTKGNGTGGESIYPPSQQNITDLWGNFVDEVFLPHSEAGLLSMANNGKNRNSSQFFITLKETPHLNGKHVVFGRVVEGMDIVQRIGKVATDSKQCPLEPVVIENCGEIKNKDQEPGTAKVTPVQAAVVSSLSGSDPGTSQTTFFGQSTQSAGFVSTAASSSIFGAKTGEVRSFASMVGKSTESPFGQSRSPAFSVFGSTTSSTIASFASLANKPQAMSFDQTQNAFGRATTPEKGVETSVFGQSRLQSTQATPLRATDFAFSPKLERDVSDDDDSRSESTESSVASDSESEASLLTPDSSEDDDFANVTI
jgi:cyclophilin family peptidyl-prolyl cis-trans isomerase